MCSQSMQIMSVDIIRCDKPSNCYRHREGQEKEWEILCYQRAWFGELHKCYLHGRQCHTIHVYVSERQSQKAIILAICTETLTQLQTNECVHCMCRPF